MLINELTYQFTYAIIDLQISIKVITHLSTHDSIIPIKREKE